MFINLLLPNYPLLQIKNNIMAAANRTGGPNYPLLQIKNNIMAAANRTGGPASQRRTAYFYPTTYLAIS
ncbi:MAG: hypothetical protein EAZ14_13390 [Runella slithyformis]|nr:MAG: hypothetical protein EAZ14_13390 [Runella slithyformis]